MGVAKVFLSERFCTNLENVIVEAASFLKLFCSEATTISTQTPLPTPRHTV